MSARSWSLTLVPTARRFDEPLLAALRPGPPPQNPRQTTIAHADNNPLSMDDFNLRCWCTWCHLHAPPSGVTSKAAGRFYGIA